MKKIHLWLLALFASVSLVACGTSDTTDSHSDETASDQQEDTFDFANEGDAETDQDFLDRAEDWWNTTVEEMEEGYETFKEKSSDLMEDAEEKYDEWKEDIEEWFTDDNEAETMDASTDEMPSDETQATES